MFTNKSPLPPRESIPSLQSFYQQSHQLILSLTSPSPPSPLPSITIVMGNESSDFDSTVSASTLAWYLSTTTPSSSTTPTHFIPVINVPRRYFKLRSEIAFEYNRLSIDPSSMTFIDDVDLRAISSLVPSFSVILTDHNRLTSHQEWMGQRVVGIVDHHQDEHLYPSSTPNRIIDKTGSCCSHVTNIIQDNHPTLLSSSYTLLPIVQLLTDVILIDTHNMNPTVKKATPHDIRAMQHLTSSFHTLLFNQLKGLRNNVQGWSTTDLLLKDSKVYTAEDYTVMISTVPLPLDEWQRTNPSMVEELVHQSKALDALIVLTSFTDKETKAYKRDLLLLVPRHPPPSKGEREGEVKVEVKKEGEGRVKLTPEQLFEVLAKGLEGDDALLLKAVDTSRRVEGLEDGEKSARSGQGAVEVGGRRLKEESHDVLVRRYDQRNVSSSRKQVAPRVESILSKL